MANAAFERGQEDGLRGRGKLFRSTTAFGIIPESDDPVADAWTEEMHADYLEGFDAGSEAAFWGAA